MTLDDERVTFTAFVEQAEPKLRRALVALRGAEEGRDAVAEALGYAWEHWSELQAMANPVGYLYRVGLSRSRPRRITRLAGRRTAQIPEFEPGLGKALRRLSQNQQAAVVLVYGCDWTYAEVAEALGVSKSSVGTHIARGMAQLRRDLEG